MFNRKLVMGLVAGVLLGSLFAAAWLTRELRWSVDRLIISPSTTFIEEPLRPDGYPDYVEALNQKMSEGVTPENNAALLLLRAMGPGGINEHSRTEFFERLGISELSPTASYFEDWNDYVRTIPHSEHPRVPPGSTDSPQTVLSLMELDASQRPWSDHEFPHMAKWLDANERHLDMVKSASRMPRFFAPAVSSGESRTLVGALSPMMRHFQDASRALLCRAMRRLGEGDKEGAWDDLMACRRLGRLEGQGPMLVDSLVGQAIDWPAYSGQAIVLAKSSLTAEQCARFQQELEELPPFSPLADKFDLGERLHAIDMILCFPREGRKKMEVFLDDPDGPFAGLSFRGVDWNIPLEMMNAWIDRCVAAARMRDVKQRRAAIAGLKAELETAAAELKEPLDGMTSLFSRKQASEQNGEIFVGFLGPALIAGFEAEARSQTNHDLLRVAAALAHYKAAQGDYPDNLSLLVPSYLETLPVDAFASAAFVYMKRSNGYLLYSLGSNQIDEGGKSYAEKADDMTIEVPWKAKPKAANGSDDLFE